MIADADAKFTESVVHLLSEPEYGNSLSREARRKVEAEYSWRRIAEAFEELYQEILVQRDPRQPQELKAMVQN